MIVSKDTFDSKHRLTEAQLRQQTQSAKSLNESHLLHHYTYNHQFLLKDSLFIASIKKICYRYLKNKKVELLSTILLQITSKSYRVLKAITTAQMKADHPTNIGDYGEKSGGQLRFAWKAIHIACDVGNRGQA